MVPTVLQGKKVDFYNFTHTDFDLIEKLKTEGYGQHTLSLKGTESLWYVYSQCHYT